MKKNFFPMALMAIAMGLNACSSDDPVVNAGGGNVPFAEGGYVKMAINMPSAPSSRAYSEGFGDGLENEYEVKNATLILFEGTSEDGAKFHSAYDLPVSMTKDGATQITSTTKIVKKVEDNVPGTNLYGYVVLNDNGLLTYSSDIKGKRIATTLSVGGMALNDATSTANNKTFKDFREKVITGGAEKFNKKGFLMDNAPLSSEQGGNSPATAPTGTVENQTLVNLTNKVYKSQAEAEAKPATDVYVERALAKVTMTKDKDITNKLEGSGVSSVTGSTVPPAISKEVSYTIVGWTLDITNNKSYLGRSCDKAWNAYAATGATAEKYRFVGSNVLGSSLYRTYWGIDPNYDSYDDTKATANFTYLNLNAKPKDPTQPNITTEATYKEGFGENNPLYCMENTFDVANMQDRQITRAIVKVKFFNGQPFYTFNDDKSTLYDKTNMDKRIKQTILSNPAVLTKLKSDFSGTTIGEGNIVLNFGTRDKYGNIFLESYTVHKTAGVTEATTDKTYTPSAGSTLNKDLQLGNIVEYENGIAYYPIRIKHFGDEQTPWNKTTADMTNPYGTTNQAQNFLGRYGVLRNNWYNITINSIKNVGSAVVPEIKIDDETTGDKPENYISVRINVLSWAKRNQSENL